MESLRKIFQKDNKTKPSADGTLSLSSLSLLITETIEDMSDGCQIIDFNYTHLYVNKSLVKQSQTTKERLIGHTMMEAYPGIETTQTFQIIKEAMEKRLFNKGETEFSFPNGTKTWFEIRIEPVEIGLIIFSIDITERKKAEDALIIENKKLGLINKEQLENSLTMKKLVTDLENAKEKIEIEKMKDDAMLASIGEGVFAVDKENHFILINKTAEELMGMNAKTLIGNHASPGDITLEYEGGLPVPKEERPTLIAIKTGKIHYNDKCIIVRKDGKRFPISLTVTPIEIDGEIIGAIDVFRDITKEKQIDKSKSEFVSLASHQLRTPLGIIKWYTEALISDEYIKSSPSVVKTNITEVSKNNERLLELVRNLLSVSRIDEGSIRNEPKDTDIVAIIKETIEQIKKIALDKNLKFNFEASNSIPLLYLDPNRFREVCENILVNAVKYNFQNGIVSVKIKLEANKVIIDISDSGIGIEKDDFEHIFTKFYRSEKAVITNPEGSGLGLYVAKTYIEDWGGKITVKSIINEGSTFTIILPINTSK